MTDREQQEKTRRQTSKGSVHLLLRKGKDFSSPLQLFLKGENILFPYRFRLFKLDVPTNFLNIYTFEL